MKYTPFKNKIAFVTAILLHLFEAAGIIFSHHKNQFIQLMPFNLVLMMLLIMWTQLHRNKAFYYFIVIAFVTGMGANIIGVNTGYLFGNYQYNYLLGTSLFGVPLAVGINWFIILYCTGMLIQRLQRWIERKMLGNAVTITPVLQTVSFVVDGALLTTFFVWVMQSAAIKLKLLVWSNNSIPMFNYVCWFTISALLLAVFRFLKFDKHNHFAVHLFFIRLLFFFLLRTIFAMQQ